MRGAVDNFKRLVRWAMSDVIHYWRVYPCEVVGQSEDGSLDLLPDDESIRGNGIQGVPLKVGLPGFRVKVPNGARVMLGYENGDPKRPYASAFEPGAIVEVAFDGGTKAVARVDDAAIGGTLLLGQGTNGSAVKQATAHAYFPPGTEESEILAMMATMNAALQAPLRVDLAAVITSGAEKLKA